MNDWPLIRCTPGPTDAELQAERDIKHAQELAEFEAEERYLARIEEHNVFRGLDHIPARAVRG